MKKIKRIFYFVPYFTSFFICACMWGSDEIYYSTKNSDASSFKKQIPICFSESTCIDKR